jgi:hypothetical protein
MQKRDLPHHLQSQPKAQKDDKPAERPDYLELVIEPSKTFLFRIDSVFETLNRIMLILDRSRRRASMEYREVLERAKEELERTSHETESADRDENVPKASSFDMSEIKKKGVAFRRAREASRIVAPSLFVSIVSQFDGYFTKLSKSLFVLRPEKLKSDRSL